MEIENNASRIRDTSGPIKWCQYIVTASYLTVGAMTLAHIVWYFAARKILAWPADIYLFHYIIYPTIGLFSLTMVADLLIRSNHVQLIAKKYISLSLFLIFSFYLCLTHRLATVLLGSFSLSIFASCIFSNIRITRWTFCMSSFALLFTCFKIYLEGKLDGDMCMELFVSYDILLCSYLVAKALIRCGNDNLMALMYSQNQQLGMQEQLKLDPFTGLYNRKTFDDYLPQLMEECKRSNICLTVAMIDVDNFKRVNDVYGHAVGDRVLLHFACILNSNKNENIHAFRMGGDEFAIIFKDYCVYNAYKVCNGMRSILDSSLLDDVDSRNVTFSCGLACMNMQLTSPAEITKAADSALYTAKNNGRNKVLIYKDSIQCIKQKGK